MTFEDEKDIETYYSSVIDRDIDYHTIICEMERLHSFLLCVL